MDEVIRADASQAEGGFRIVDFKDRPPWWVGDLQTLRNFFMAQSESLPSTSSTLEFEISDGSWDWLMGRLERPLATGVARPLILLIHGLTGCEDSTYVRASARFHLARGRTVLRLNLRGAGPSKRAVRSYYHAGCAADVQDVLDGLGDEQTRGGIFPVGFSLGGNILLNLLAGLKPGHRIIGAVAVSAPIEPLEACRRLMAPRNVLYHRWLLKRMKQDVLALAELTSREHRVITDARSVYEFDDRWVAPRNGFRDAEDYYERTAGARRIASISVPTLLLYARNDPWIPVEPHLGLANSAAPPVQILVAQSGGHVGFHERRLAETWHDRMIEVFLGGLLTATPDFDNDIGRDVAYWYDLG